MIGITPFFEKGRCSICKKNKEVRIIIDEKNKIILRVCEKCANSDFTIEEALMKYGRKVKRIPKNLTFQKRKLRK